MIRRTILTADFSSDHQNEMPPLPVELNPGDDTVDPRETQRRLATQRLSQRRSMEEIGIDEDFYNRGETSQQSSKVSSRSVTVVDDDTTESNWDMTLSLASTLQRQTLSASNKDNWVKGGEWEMHQRVNDFYQARDFRRKFGEGLPRSGFGLFRYLVDLKIDIDWTKECAFRRKEGQPIVSWSEHDRQQKEKWFHLPLLTCTLVVLSAIMMACELIKNDWQVEPFSVNPMLGPSAKVLIDMGALVTLKITDDGEYERIIGSLFLYSGLIQFFATQLVVYLLVKPIERIYGTMLTTIVFILTGIGANLTCALLSPELVTVGPTGAIFGLIGFCLADILKNWDLILKGIPGHEHESPFSQNGKVPYMHACVIFLVELATAFAIGLLPYVDNMADLGGFHYGLGIGMILLRKETISSDFFCTVPQKSKILNICWKVFWGLKTVLIFAITFLVLRHTDGIPSVCLNCKYLSCIPFPFWEPHDKQWWNCDVCHSTAGHLVNGKIEMTCPYGETVLLNQNEEEFEAMLPEYCEIHCDIGN